MKGLTSKQRDILQFIQNFINENRYSPSYREIMEHFSFASPGSVYKYIQTLKRKGLLSSEKQCSRSLMPYETTSPSKVDKAEIELPFIGHLTGGYPIELFMQSQHLTIPTFMVPSPDKTYLLRVRGNQLYEEFIHDGDLLLVEARQEAQAGETIVALINQHEAIIKCYYPEGQYIRLEGHHHQPMILRQTSVAIQGVLVGLIRTY